MLIELRVHNYAIIDQVAVRLESGLNVLTGETGAGKSIIVGALSLLLGERASADSVRTGAQRAVIEGVFDISGRDALIALIDEYGIEPEDGLLVLRREVAAEGRSRAWVNGAASTAALVGELGRQLVDLHGQHEHQTLVRADEQRSILDAYGGSSDVADQVAGAYARVRESAARLEELERRAREVQARADYLRHQADEIEAAAPQLGEEEELEAEAKRLHHAEELSRLASELHHELYQAEGAITSRLDGLRRALDHLIRIDETLAENREVLDNAYYGLEELGRRMGDYASLVDHDPARLDEIRRRLDVLFRLKSKYGPDLGAVIEAGNSARQELDSLDRAHLDRKALARQLDESRARHVDLCAKLSKQRRAAAKRLDAEITEILPELGMSGGRFVTVLTPNEPVGRGAESVEFRVTVNEGFEPRPLARVASGGELSRIMLALKSVLARVDRIPTLVFDEIDAGIGGRVAHHVADKLKRVAAHHQVFVITHLAQIASRADHHLLVEKVTSGGTVAALRELHGDARVHELARLLGGDPESSASIAHAREMLTTN